MDLTKKTVTRRVAVLKRGAWILGVLVILIGAVFGRRVYQDYSRPLFHNIYGRNDRMLFSRWMWQPPMIDNTGKVAIADYRLNLLVVAVPVVADTPGTTQEERGMSVWRSIVFTATRNGATASLGGQEGPDVSIPRTRNTLLICLPDGTTDGVPLDPGEAERFFERLHDERPHDLFGALEELCGSDVPDTTQFLRSCRGRLQGMQ